MHKAVIAGDVEAVKRLAPTEANTRDWTFNTPMDYAVQAQYDRPEMIRILTEAGAEWNPNHLAILANRGLWESYDYLSKKVLGRYYVMVDPDKLSDPALAHWARLNPEREMVRQWSKRVLRALRKAKRDAPVVLIDVDPKPLHRDDTAAIAEPCISCLVHARRILFTQCGHLCYCHECSRRTADQPCPLCRKNGPRFTIYV